MKMQCDYCTNTAEVVRDHAGSFSCVIPTTPIQYNSPLMALTAVGHLPLNECVLRSYAVRVQ